MNINIKQEIMLPVTPSYTSDNIFLLAKFLKYIQLSYPLLVKEK